MIKIFLSVLVTSCVGSFLALFLLLLRPQTKKRFSADWHYYMWLVVLFVMVCPLRVTLPQSTPESYVVIPAQEQVQTEPETMDAPVFITETAPIQAAEETEPVNDLADGGGVARSIVLLVASAVWMLGFLAMCLIKLIGYVGFLHKIRKHSEETKTLSLQAYTKRNVRVRLSETICSPLVVGFVKPTLLLPKTPLTEAQTDYVLSHEMTHVNRMDILYKWFVCFVKCVHWFNPMVYFVSRKVNLDCEIACDAAVTKEMDGETKRGYMETILSLLSNNNRQVIPLTTGMTGEKKSLMARFSSLKNKLHISKKTVIISLAVAILFLLLGTVCSGLLNGMLVPANDSDLLQVSTDVRQGDDFNVLLLGLDDAGRADSILVFFCRDSKINGMSIPRDAVFKTTGDNSLKKVTEILAMENGDQKVIDTLRNQLSIPIHYYAKINLLAVRDLVDALGGLEFDVMEGIVYDDPVQNLHIDLEPGVRVLSGEEVCHLLRYRRSNDGRGYPQGDLGRVSLGQTVMEELIRQKLNTEMIRKLPELLASIKENVQTNYPFSTLVRDVKKLEEADKDFSFTSYIAPGVVEVDENNVVIYDIKSGAVQSVYSVPTLLESEWSKTEIESIKSTATGAEPYIGFEHITLSDASRVNLQEILHKSGVTKETGKMVNLQKQYAVKPYGTKMQIMADQNGNVSLYMPGREQNFSVVFTDAQTGESVGDYGVLGNDTNAYTFLGFEKEKIYTVTVQPQTGTDWVQTGSYYIY